MNALLVICCLLAGQAPAIPAAGDALDDQLLEGLDDALDDAVKKPQAQPPRANPPAATEQQPPTPAKPGESPLDQQLLEGLEGGESSSAEGNPLLQLGQRMQQVQQRIGQAQTDESTQALQNQIVSDLDALIREARRNAQQSQSKSRNSQNQGSQRSQVKPGEPQSGSGEGAPGEPGEGQAQESTERLGPNDALAPNMEEMQGLIEGLWGQLPERLREQMRQSAAERFLPQYQTQIEQYFRRLVETPEDRP
ncbi:MAG: hypothetical protein K1X74_19045 [Pirellulales bacterium]|nr:hypothetical protein [Pirellulales bacterium]